MSELDNSESKPVEPKEAEAKAEAETKGETKNSIPFYKNRKFHMGLIALGIFGLGVLFGSIKTIRHIHHQFKSIHGNPDSIPARIVNRMGDKLDLTEEQEVEALRIVSDHFATIREEIEGILPKIKAEFEAGQTELKTILTPEQVLKLEELNKKRHNFMEKMKSKGHRGHGGCGGCGGHDDDETEKTE